jgi:cell wall assembly regulator SMI1
MTQLPALLGRLESGWDSRGVAVRDYFAPGLAPDDITSLLLDAALPTPTEIVEWYVWHNGNGPNAERRAPLGPSGWRAMAVQDALEERLVRLEQAIQLAEDMGDGASAAHWWAPTWLPIAENGGPDVLAVDLGTGRETVDVRNIGWEDPETFPVVWVTSLADVVSTWQRVLDTGGWQWNPRVTVWEGDQGSLSSDIATIMLM